MATELPGPCGSDSGDLLDRFEAWWEEHGQFCRAGGGQYEKTFAYRAFEYAEAAAVLAERERASLICEEFANDEWSHSETACRCAEAIRARSNAEITGLSG